MVFNTENFSEICLGPPPVQNLLTLSDKEVVIGLRPDGCESHAVSSRAEGVGLRVGEGARSGHREGLGDTLALDHVEAVGDPAVVLCKENAQDVELKKSLISRTDTD